MKKKSKNVLTKFMNLFACVLMAVTSALPMNVVSAEGTLSFRGVEDVVLTTSDSIQLLDLVEVYDGE